MEHDADRREDVTAEAGSPGIVVTAEGKRRARKLLADADARRDPDRRAKLRAELGLTSTRTQ